MAGLQEKHKKLINSSLICLGAALLSVFVIGGKGEKAGEQVYYWSRVGTLVLIGVVFVARAYAYGAKLFAEKSEYEKFGSDYFELGTLAVFVIAGACALSGFSYSPVYPLLYFVVAAVAIFSPGWASIAVCAVAVAATGGLFFMVKNYDNAAVVAAVQAALLPAFALFYRLYLRAEAQFASIRRKIEAEKIYLTAKKEAVWFRRTGVSKDMSVSSILSSHFEIHYVLQNMLKLVKKLLAAKSVVVLWNDETGERLQILEKVSDSKLPFHADVPSDKGLILGVVKNGAAVNLTGLDWERRPAPYYQGKEDSNAFAAVPIKNSGKIFGAICVDRKEDVFSASEIEILEYAAEEVVRSLMNESLYQTIIKSRNEQLRLSKASAALSQTLSLDSVFDTAMDELEKICEHDLTVIALVDQDGSSIKDVRAKGVLMKAIFPDGAGVSGEKSVLKWVIDKKEQLIRPDLSSMEIRPFIFCEKENIREIRAIYISPLFAGQRFLGAMVLGSKTPMKFNDEDLIGTVQVVSNQISVCLENAMIYEAMQRMAITDALTGLYNRRFFMERFGEMLMRSERNRSKLAVVMCDIDFFKKINDTYGHPVGDEVLKKVAKTLSSSIRRIDLLARYGGEEFIFVLEGLSHNDGKRKVEEIMEKIRALEFVTEIGKFSMTMSFGLAVFPNDANDADALLHLADEALYHSKRNGRNRVTLSSEQKG